MAKFTNAPLPSLGLLRKAFFNNKSSKEYFLKLWRLDNHLTLSLSRSAWSMQLIAKFRLMQSNESLINILVPSYFCNSSLAPLREMDANLFFYPIKKNGEPDMEEILKILSENKIDIIIAAHFFGNHIDLSDLSAAARASNIWFVEDCAHLLYFPEEDKIKSDFKLFSPHKFLSIPDGAIISVNKDIFNSLDELEGFEDFYREYVKKGSSQIKVYVWLFKRLLQKLNFGVKLGVKDFYDDEEINTTKGFFKPSMTSFSQTLLSELVDHIQEEYTARYENANAWKNKICSRYPSAKIVFKEESQFSIYLLGFKFSDEQDLQDALTWLDKMNYPTCTWPDLPAEVLEEENYFRNSIELRNKSIFFHVHSSINKKHIESSF
jgi:dTDP-4-amino-4,6-dideoxygalactose transaminase